MSRLNDYFLHCLKRVISASGRASLKGQTWGELNFQVIIKHFGCLRCGNGDSSPQIIGFNKYLFYHGEPLAPFFNIDIF